MENWICELKAPKYWEGSALKFDRLFLNGLKHRRNHLSVIDEKVMEEVVTDGEHEKAKRLPYRELCGVCSYLASCSKLEMRYAISVCGRHREKWGRRQLDVLRKVFEYGHATREIGLIYSKGLCDHGLNTLCCYAHSLPRSQGCALVMRNGAAISCTFKKPAITAS